MSANDPRVRARVADRAARTFLPEVQALRAIAVALVVAFHLYPAGRLTQGGFVGVDVFFVISGYLITSHLLREVEHTGTVRLGAFYARRARRLLPASLLVLLAALGLTIAYLPQTDWSGAATETMASAFYVQNLYLASQSVTYSAQGAAPSAVQHYWSLSVEEQFYLLWPAIILLALWVNRRRRGTRPVTTVGAALVLVCAASFVASVLWTRTSAAQAYFVTPTRAWEFGTGALIVLVLRRWVPTPRQATALRIIGLLAITASSVRLSQASAFPGWVAAVPVLGTAAVIAAGAPQPGSIMDRLVNLPPTQWLGRISYSVYLWHWPLIVVAPYALTEDTLRWYHKLAIIVLTLVLAHLTQRFVEDATRYVPALRRRTRPALLAALAGMLVVLGAGQATQAYADNETRRIEAVLRSRTTDECFGARAGLNQARCPQAFTERPLAASIKGDFPLQNFCGNRDAGDRIQRCMWFKNAKTVALVGDSHAQQWLPVLQTDFRKIGWNLVIYYKPECAPTHGDLPRFLHKTRGPQECADWTRRVAGLLAKDKPDLILTTAYYSASGGVPAADLTRGYQQAWASFTPVAPVLVLRDSPNTGEQAMPACVKVHMVDVRGCSRPRSLALADAPLVEAVKTYSGGGDVSLIDFTDAYCDATTCYGVVGSVPVYADRNHLTVSFERTLVGPLMQRLQAAMASATAG